MIEHHLPMSFHIFMLFVFLRKTVPVHHLYTIASMNILISFRTVFDLLPKTKATIVSPLP